MDGEDIVAAARALVGTRFRLHGRDGRGIDCVGLVARATGRAGVTGYPLRGVAAARAERELAAAGFARVADMRAGDVLLLLSGPAQLHLGIRTADGFVHAHAGLRRVVETPGRPDGVLSAWRAA